MFRLLIVDDEPYIRERLRTCINWSHLNIEIVGEAENGLEGLSIAMEQQPDIVICDVRMPRMDGIAFATEFQYHFPSSQIIFLSGYSDKEYMKNAIRLEAVDYIFKPYELSDLLAAVEKSILRLNKASSQKIVKGNDDLVLKLLYLADYPDKLQDFLQNHPLALNFASPWICLLIRFNSGISFAQYKNGTLPDLLEVHHLINRYYYDFETHVKDLFGNSYLMTKAGNNYMIFANLPENGNITDSLLSRLSGMLAIIPDFPVAIGISPVAEACKNIKFAFQKAREASLCGFLSHHCQIFTAPSLRTFSSDHESRRNFFVSLENQNIPNASSSFDEYITYLGSCSPQYIPSIREDLLQIVLSLNKKLKKPPFPLVGEFISSAAALEDIRQYGQFLLKQYLSELDSMDERGKIIFETEQYILDHLGDPLTVRQIADHVFISHTYLCFLYKKKTGKTLNQFILDARMKKARSLLLDTSMKIGDIAASLSYANQNYFTKIFVSYYGTTPSNFRNHPR